MYHSARADCHRFLHTSSRILHFSYYSSGLCASFKVFKEWQTADGMEEGGVRVCVRGQLIGKAAPWYRMTGRAPLRLSQS